MKLSNWARKHGISYKTAWKGWQASVLPVRARQRPTGTIRVEAAPEASGETVVADPRGDLDRQGARRVEGATERGLRVGWIVREGGFGTQRSAPASAGGGHRGRDAGPAGAVGV
jgi:putative resolvase